MESFAKLQPITSMKNVSGLRAIYDLLEENVHNLSSLGVPSGTYGKLLIEKIPHNFRLVIPCKFNDKVWELKNVKIFQKRAFCKGTLCRVS